MSTGAKGLIISFTLLVDRVRRAAPSPLKEYKVRVRGQELDRALLIKKQHLTDKHWPPPLSPGILPWGGLKYYTSMHAHSHTSMHKSGPRINQQPCQSLLSLSHQRWVRPEEFSLSQHLCLFASLSNDFPMGMEKLAISEGVGFWEVFDLPQEILLWSSANLYLYKRG